MSEKKKGQYILLSFNLKSTCFLLVGGKSWVDPAFIGIRVNTFAYALKYLKNKIYADVLRGAIGRNMHYPF